MGRIGGWILSFLGTWILILFALLVATLGDGGLSGFPTEWRGWEDLLNLLVFIGASRFLVFLGAGLFLLLWLVIHESLRNSERIWGLESLLQKTVQKLSERGALKEEDLEDPEMRRIVSEQLKGKRPDLNLNPDQIRALWKDPKFGPSLREAIETPAQTAEISGGGSR